MHTSVQANLPGWLVFGAKARLRMVLLVECKICFWFNFVACAVHLRSVLVGVQKLAGLGDIYGRQGLSVLGGPSVGYGRVPCGHGLELGQLGQPLRVC